MSFDQNAGRLLGSLHALDARTAASEKKILESALQRDEVVRAQMDELRPRVLTEPGAAHAYKVAALELRRLGVVIAMARAHIGEDAQKS